MTGPDEDVRTGVEKRFLTRRLGRPGLQMTFTWYTYYIRDSPQEVVVSSRSRA